MVHFLVAFPEEEGKIDLIHKSWRRGKDCCLWPPNDVANYQKNGTKPPKDAKNWTSVKITLMKPKAGFKTYGDAVEALKKATIATDLSAASSEDSDEAVLSSSAEESSDDAKDDSETDIEVKKRSTKRKSKQETTSKPKNSKKARTKRQTTAPTTGETSAQQPSEQLPRNSTQGPKEPPKDQATQTDRFDIAGTVQDTYNLIQNEVVPMLVKIGEKTIIPSDPGPSQSQSPTQSETGNLIQTRLSFLKVPFHFPIRKAADLCMFESKYAKDPQFKKDMETYIDMQGGKDVKEATNRAFDTLLCYELGAGFSLQGVGDKQPFEQLQLCQAVKEVVMAKFKSDRKTVEDRIAAWLKKVSPLAPDSKAKKKPPAKEPRKLKQRSIDFLKLQEKFDAKEGSAIEKDISSDKAAPLSTNSAIQVDENSPIATNSVEPLKAESTLTSEHDDSSLSKE